MKRKTFLVRVCVFACVQMLHLSKYKQALKHRFENISESLLQRCNQWKRETNKKTTGRGRKEDR